MKNLNLNACGVEEMSNHEMAETNGGSLLSVLCIVGAVAAAICLPGGGFLAVGLLAASEYV